MKRRIIVLLVFLIAINSYGLNPLSVEFSLELGWLPEGTLVMYESWKAYDLSNMFYVVLASRVNLFEYLFIGGSMDVSLHREGLEFYPNGIDYMFETGIQIGILELFFKHNCIHPAPTWIYFQRMNLKWETWHNRIGIKISGELK